MYTLCNTLQCTGAVLRNSIWYNMLQRDCIGPTYPHCIGSHTDLNANSSQSRSASRDVIIIFLEDSSIAVQLARRSSILCSYFAIAIVLNNLFMFLLLPCLFWCSFFFKKNKEAFIYSKEAIIIMEIPFSEIYLFWIAG